MTPSLQTPNDLRWSLTVVAATVFVGVVFVKPPEVPAALSLPPTHLQPVRVDQPLRGYFYAGFPGEAADNAPRPLAGMADAPPAIGLQVIAQPEVRREFGEGNDGFRVLVINAGTHSESLAAQDARLAMVHEALAPTGVWVEIEHLPRSWCGNSYHEMSLAAGHYWELTAPRYAGTFATQLRIRLAVSDPQDPQGHSRFVYSSSFAGRINLGQLVSAPETPRR